MRYFSTRDNSHSHPFSLSEAAFLGLAPDGGLIVPEYVPKLDFNKIKEMSDGKDGFRNVAFYAAERYFAEDIGPDVLKTVIEKAFDFDIVLNNIDSKLFTLELFHGPTFAFKDFGARFMGQMFQRINRSDEEIVILAATSGDTGSAVANGFLGVEGIKVVLLYPEGKVSPLQEAQMTSLGRNICPLRVKGTFDDCQRLVKQAFGDKALRERKRITSANSINLLRWIPQSFYYLYATALWINSTGSAAPDIAVPSGNYGNLSAGMLAAASGMPVRQFIAASNANDVIPEFLKTGVFRPRPSIRTEANAMDVGNPSNFERMMWLANERVDLLQKNLKGFSADDSAINNAIAQMFSRYGYISDPHSAVGYLAAIKYDIDGYWLSTAHYAKFGNVIKDAIGVDVTLPPALQKAMEAKHLSIPIPADLKALDEILFC